ncbi:hypothetical protein NDA15_000824 [Ustilago hordei]|nr:hypothetical protein NDA15_000824 [Ustilago hordei]
MGPKVMVTTADPFEEATDSGDGHTGSTETDPKAMDLSSYQQPMDLDHEEEEHDDDNDEGNVSGSGSFKQLLTITMTDQDLNNKLDRLLALMEAQLELTRQSHREERLRRAHLTEEATDLSHSEDQAGGGDESMIGDPHTPTPAPRSRPSVSFNLNEHAETNYEKYASPTGPKYLKTRDPYSRSRVDPYVQDQEEEASIMADRSKPIATPFPKFNPRDIEIYILEAEAWFRFNQVYEHTRMINHLGSQLEGTAREWWTSKLRFDRAREGGYSMTGSSSPSD